MNASEPWLALLGESSKERAIAWDVDQKNHQCLEERAYTL